MLPSRHLCEASLPTLFSYSNVRDAPPSSTSSSDMRGRGRGHLQPTRTQRQQQQKNAGERKVCQQHMSKHNCVHALLNSVFFFFLSVETLLVYILFSTTKSANLPPPLRWLWSKVVGGKGGRGVLVVSQIWILLLLPARQGREEDAISGQRKQEKISFFSLLLTNNPCMTRIELRMGENIPSPTAATLLSHLFIF